MNVPEDYLGPTQYAVPRGYIDVTCLFDQGRRGIPSPEHPFYRTRDKIAAVIRESISVDFNESINIADKIMAAL